VRRDHDVRKLEQRAGVGLLREHVDRCACDLARSQRLDERFLVDELTACGVDDSHAVAHRRDRVSIDHTVRLRRQRQVERQEVRARERVLPRGALDAELAEPVGRDEGVVRDHLHSEPECAPRDLLADPAEAEDADRLLRELDPSPLRPLPAAALERCVCLRDVARKGNEQTDGVLGGRDDVRLGRIRDDDPAAGRGVDVDVVHTHSGAADDLHRVRLVDEIGRQLGRRPDDDRVVATDDLVQGRVAIHVDVEPRAE
jgi:hypothetical protein